ncbi:MAG: hypothetical protein ACI8WB_001461 [Phenylobacterium sp.]
MIHIALDRLFQEYKQDLSSVGESYHYDDKYQLYEHNWSWLLTHPRVVLLGEAGSGKTLEMQAQVKKLCSMQQHAFFLPLEAIESADITSLMSYSESERFRRWQSENETPAWFFLDAIDELKLRKGKIDHALRFFANAVRQQLCRVNLVLSCRPSDWTPLADLSTLSQVLPVIKPPAIQPSIQSESGESLFISLIKNQSPYVNNRNDESSENPDTEHNDEHKDRVKVVRLSPLDSYRMRIFAQHKGVVDTDKFIEELGRLELDELASRPLDLTFLIQIWQKNNCFGTLEEQLGLLVTTKLEETNQGSDKRLILSHSEVHSGVMRLALASVLGRTRSIATLGELVQCELNESLINPKQILYDWDDQKIRALLSRAIFDPATFGRVKFHHRIVQEYLAAKQLNKLTQDGMSINQLFDLLFSELFGQKLVIPFMAPVAAWLAIWDDNVFQELLRREPEVLLQAGDPGALFPDMRISLLNAFAKLYGRGNERGISIDHNQLSRLACEELAPTIKALWGTDGARLSPDLRQLLLRLIWKGPIFGCSDIVKQAARTVSFSIYHRATAIRAMALLECRQNLSQIIKDIFVHPKDWPYELVRSMAGELLPHHIAANELTSIVKAYERESRRRSSDSITMRLINAFESAEMSDSIRQAFVNAFAVLVCDHSAITQYDGVIVGEFSHIEPVLSVLCLRQLEKSTEHGDELVNAIAIAWCFRGSNSFVDKYIDQLITAVNKTANLRERVFWATKTHVSRASRDEIPRDRQYQLTWCNIIEPLEVQDVPWLIGALTNSSEENKQIALSNLGQLHKVESLEQHQVDLIAKKVSSNIGLKEEWHDWTKPRVETETMIRHNKKRTERRRKEEQAESERIGGWLKWRDTLLSNPAAILAAETIDKAVDDFDQILTGFYNSSTVSEPWNRILFAGMFNEDVFVAFEKAYRLHWRKYDPPLWSEKQPIERNRVIYAHQFGLNGVYLDSHIEGWCELLSHEEARIAIRYATVESNGFPAFIDDLAKCFPQLVSEILGGELDLFFQQCSSEQCDTLYVQNIRYSKPNLQRLLEPRIFNWLRHLQGESAAFVGCIPSSIIGNIIEIYKSISDVREHSDIGDLYLKLYQIASAENNSMQWLKGAFVFTPIQAFKIVIQYVEGLTDPTQYLEMFIGDFFEDDYSYLFRQISDEAKAEYLGKLCRLTYQHIRLQYDQHRDGTYSPNMRDHAQRGRDNLTYELLKVPNQQALEEFRLLLDMPCVSSVATRFTMALRRELAQRAEREAPKPEQLIQFEKLLALPPQDSKALFKVLDNRLSDLEHYIRHSEFSDRPLLLLAKQEALLQPTIAMRLDLSSRGAYRVARESEVADGKKPDIQILTIIGRKKAAIELKRADNWTILQLVKALEAQLVGQYLRHDDCTTGFLLLTYHGDKSYWKHSNTRKQMRFEDVVNFLNGHAKRIMQTSDSELFIKVHGIDLTAPYLAPAH